ncbi:ligand-binding sensor domain-containing protein [Flavisolibacter ginsengisoli]|nr:two-component regulator propeller domain-containing protein [Flavisolibacter ginsengisoli]
MKYSCIIFLRIKFEIIILAALVRFVNSVILLLFLTVTAYSQHARQYSFKHFSVSNGLASNTVSATIQDDQGYMWFATVNGLQRYDGNGFITFKSNEKDPHAIPSTHIITLFLDNKKRLWLYGDNQKVGIFDTRKFIFKEVSVQDKKPFYDPVSFRQLPTGELILKAYGLLYEYSEKENFFAPARLIGGLPHNWVLNDIYWDTARKRYWISCDSGLVQYDPQSKHVNYRGHNVDNDPVIEAFKNQLKPFGAFSDAHSNLVFVYWPPTQGAPEIKRYNQETKKTESFKLWSQLGYHEINGFLLQRNGRLWVYGMPFFMEWTEEKQPFILLSGENLDEPKIKYDYAYQAFEDRESNIWISTDNGVFLFNPDAQIFNTYGLVGPGDKATKERPVQAVIQLKDDRIFVGTWGSSGIYCFDKNFNPIPLPSCMKEKGKYYTVWDMAVNSKTGELWITLQAGGLVIYNPKTNKLFESYPEIFSKSTIRQIDEDTSGNMWFGTQNGKVIKWDIDKANGDPSKGYELVCQTTMVYKVHFDYQGFIWVGTFGDGLLKIDTRTKRIVKRFTKESVEGERIFNNFPSDMTYYNDTTLIVTGGAINIVNTRTNKVSFLSDVDGLPSNTAESIEKDDNGILWVGMTNGICRVNLSKKLISYYDRRDGIAYDKFAKTGVQELNDGRLVFFTDHNFLVFNPSIFTQRNKPYKPYLTSFMLGGKALSMDSLSKAGKVILNYDNTSIGINFSALSYLQQTKLHYYYRLEGADKDWIHADKPSEALYNYLAPGSYTFQVKTENTDGITSSEIASFLIIVRPPFWSTWWFYGLVILLIITILYVLDKERINKRASLRQMRRQIAGNLHQEISRTLNNINVLSEIAKIKADKNIEQSKDFITQISSKSRYMMEAMDDMLWSIDPQNDSMKKTILRIKELTEGLRSSYDVDIDLIVDHKVQLLELDMKFRHDIFFFYKEALTYMLENICCNQIFVNINQVKSKMMVEILSECDESTADFKSRFQKAMHKRSENLSANMEVTTDNKSISVVLLVNLKS